MPVSSSQKQRSWRVQQRKQDIDGACRPEMRLALQGVQGASG